MKCLKPLGLLTALLLSTWVAPAQAQLGTAKWKFTNRQQIETAARKNLNNLRASYEIIVCANRQGMGRTATGFYQKLTAKAPLDATPNVAASYATAYFLMMHRLSWDWKIDNDYKACSLGSGDAIRMTLFRDRALEQLPRSPEVLLINGIWQGDSDDYPQALSLLRQAIKYDPKWEDLQWVYAHTLQRSYFNTPDGKKRGTQYGQQMLSALNKIKKDTVLRRETLLLYTIAYDILKERREALRCIEAYIRARPEYIAYRNKTFGAGSFERELEARRARISASN